MQEDENILPEKFNVYCFNENPEIIVMLLYNQQIHLWDKNFNPIYNIFSFSEENIKISIDEYMQNKNAVSLEEILNLSKQLSKGFKFVRVDWMLNRGNIYFEELTFSPYSGFHKFKSRKENLKLGKKIEL